jgi:hypothetical protein
LKILILLLFLPFAINAQTCDHISNSKQRFEAIRLLPPVSIRNADPAKIEYTFEDKHTIQAGTLQMDNSTVRPPDFMKTYSKKKWWVLYSICDSHVYTIVEVTPLQFIKK